MKTLSTILTLSFLAFSAAAFATTDDDNSVKNLKVPVAPSVWESEEIEAPESLRYIKAKNAYVPIANFVWGSPFEAPVELLMVPVAPFVYGDCSEEAPEAIGFLKAKSAFVPVAPFDWGIATDDIGLMIK